MENINNDLLSRMANRIDIKILEHGFFTGDKTWRYFDVYSYFNRLYFVTGGQGFAETAGKRFDLIPGNVYLIPLKIKFNIYCNDHIEKFYIHFTSEISPGSDLFDGSTDCCVKSFEKEYINDMLLHAKGTHLTDIALFKSALFMVIAGYIPDNTEKIIQKVLLSEKYEQVFAYIKANINADLSADIVAFALGFSAFELNRRFRFDMGMTLNSYIKGVLLAKSMEMLLFTDQSIREIAFSLRFSDEFYFSRFFRKHTGMPPKIYRNINKIN